MEIEYLPCSTLSPKPLPYVICKRGLGHEHVQFLNAANQSSSLFISFCIEFSVGKKNKKRVFDC